MDKISDFPPYSPYGMGYENMDEMYNNPMFNPLMQYEQAYMYYRYMTQNLEYKIKLKEYEKLCKDESRKERKVDWKRMH